MTATTIVFPTASRRAEVEQDRAGGNSLEHAIEKARAIAARIVTGTRHATLADELEELAGLVRRLERTEPLHVDDFAIIQFGPAMVRWPLRDVPEMLAGLMAA